MNCWLGSWCTQTLPEKCCIDAEFSLETFRHKLDEQGMSIAENQEQSVKSRKRLAETTRGTQHLLSIQITV